MRRVAADHSTGHTGPLLLSARPGRKVGKYLRPPTVRQAREVGPRCHCGFAVLEFAQQRTLCDGICYVPAAAPALLTGARFFARFRDVTAGGLYTTPAGTKDLGFVGNVVLNRFEGRCRRS